PSSAGDRAAPARAAPRRFRRRDPGPARDRGAAFRRARAAGRGGTGLGDAQARAQGPGGEPRGGTMTVRAVLIGALSLPRRLVALPVRAYQVGISPYTPPACLYAPVCSQYAMYALRVRGAVKSILLTCGPILRCHPLSKVGPEPGAAPGMWTNPRRLRRPAPSGLLLSQTLDHTPSSRMNVMRIRAAGSPGR